MLPADSNITTAIWKEGNFVQANSFICLNFLPENLNHWTF